MGNSVWGRRGGTGALLSAEGSPLPTPTPGPRRAARQTSEPRGAASSGGASSPTPRTSILGTFVCSRAQAGGGGWADSGVNRLVSSPSSKSGLAFVLYELTE